MIVNYDNLATDYLRYRVPDSRIAAALGKHIPANAKVLNVGAGLGSYEPENCDITAIEPSKEMIARRSSTKVPAMHGFAEALPFEDDAFDVSMAILTTHHWEDLQKGLSELKRVTLGKVIIFTWSGVYKNFWLLDYLPEIEEIDGASFPRIDDLVTMLGGATVETVDIPHDCTDGFMCAYWRRPEMYLDSGARRAISTFSRLGNISEALELLAKDIETGTWKDKYGHLLHQTNLDCGYRLVVHETNAA